MNRFLLSLSLFFFMAISVCAEWRPGNYTWVSPSLNVSESMPCGGGDVGMNVWVEQGFFDVEEQYQQDMENYLMRDTDVSYNSISTLKANVLGIKNVVLLVGGMIGAVFALVGLINFINLVMTNIVTRRHEFATMQSIGMTNRQLRKMMISESFSYVLLAGIVGTLVAATLGMTLLRAFVENGPTSMMMTFQITLLPALIMLVLFLVLAFIVPVIALRLFNNRSVVERLRVNE